MQEWLDCGATRGQLYANAQQAQALRDRWWPGRDIIEHIERGAPRPAAGAVGRETVVQIHFSAQSNRTNDIMRNSRTALTAIFAAQPDHGASA
jgi:hypothetical protein